MQIIQIILYVDMPEFMSLLSFCSPVFSVSLSPLTFLFSFHLTAHTISPSLFLRFFFSTFIPHVFYHEQLLLILVDDETVLSSLYQNGSQELLATPKFKCQNSPHVFIKFKVRYTFSSTRKSHICNFFMKEISVLQSPHRPDDEGRKDL